MTIYFLENSGLTFLIDITLAKFFNFLVQLLFSSNSLNSFTKCFSLQTEEDHANVQPDLWQNENTKRKIFGKFFNLHKKAWAGTKEDSKKWLAKFGDEFYSKHQNSAEKRQRTVKNNNSVNMYEHGKNSSRKMNTQRPNWTMQVVSEFAVVLANFTILAKFETLDWN